MAITIQELLASDTISQAADKINFNFDQLLLNGGGPVGPPGPIGPSGPIGGRGERGTEWYEGVGDPNIIPPTPTPLIADYYLQSNGDVWEYTGLAWTNTGINLRGPAGPAGVSGGWSEFGSNPIGVYAVSASNVAYPSLIDTNTEVTATPDNQGVKVAAFGIAGPNDSNLFLDDPTADDKFKLSTMIAGSLDASVLSILTRQGNSNSKGIVFMGGGAIIAENYEQDNIDNLSYINLGADDTININVPKPTTVYNSDSDLIGFNVYTELRGQNFRSGNNFTVTTGTKNNIDTGSDNSNIEFTVNKIPNSTTGIPSFSVNTLGLTGQTSMVLGPVPASNTTNSLFDGGIQFKSDILNIATNLTTDILSDNAASIRVPVSGGGVSGLNQLSINTTGIGLTAFNNPINISSGTGAISISNTFAPISVNSVESINLVTTKFAIPVNLTTASVELSQTLLRMAGYGTGDGSVNDWENNNVIISSQREGKNVMIGIGLIGGTQDNNTGKIILGKKQNSANRAFYSNIRLDYQLDASAAGIIQLSGNYQYTPGGEPTPLASLKDPQTGDYTQKAFQATPTTSNNLGMGVGDVMFRNGVYSDSVNDRMVSGVAQEGWMDSGNGAIWIGKTLDKVLEGGDTANIGLFVNKPAPRSAFLSSTILEPKKYWQGLTNYGEFYPSTEVFGATTQGIHLSTKVLWGGNNNAAGVKYINIDMFQKFAGNRGPTVVYTLSGNHNYYKIVAGPTGYGQISQGGTGMNYTDPLASNFNFYGSIPGDTDQPTCLIELANPGEGAKGQMVIVEIILASGYLKTEDATGVQTEFFLRPKINFTWEEGNSSGTTPVQDVEGNAIGGYDSVGNPTVLIANTIPNSSNGYRPQYIRWVGQFIYNGEQLPFLGSSLLPNDVTDFNGTPRWTLIGATQSTTTSLTQTGYGA